METDVRGNIVITFQHIGR